jgi:hypothetical protein
MAQPLAGRTLTVTVGGDLNTEQIATVVERVFESAGCKGCTSGANFLLRQESEWVVDPQLNVRAATHPAT